MAFVGYSIFGTVISDIVTLKLYLTKAKRSIFIKSYCYACYKLQIFMLLVKIKNKHHQNLHQFSFEKYSAYILIFVHSAAPARTFGHT